MQKSFTLIELMIVVALIFLSASFTFLISYGFFQKSTLEDQARNIESSLRSIQASAITGKGDSNFGIKLSQTSYTLFEGEFYSGRREAVDMVINYPIAMSVSGAEEIVFRKTTGFPIFPGLLGHWEFNEESGNIAYDSSYYLNQDQGTISGMYSRVQGKDNNSLEFNGNARVDAENSSNLNPGEEITVSAWVNISSAQECGIIEKGNPQAGAGYSLSLSGEGLVVFSLGDGASAQTVSNVYDSELLGDWVYLAAVWDGETLKQYINGREQPETASFSGSIGQSESDLVIGDGLTGRIDDVRLYGYALSGEDIETNYLARSDDISVGLRFGANRKYIIINSQGKIDTID